MGIIWTEDGQPPIQQSVDVEVEVKATDFKGRTVVQKFALDRCHMHVHRPIVQCPSGELIPSDKQVLVLHGVGKIEEDE